MLQVELQYYVGHTGRSSVHFLMSILESNNIQKDFNKKRMRIFSTSQSTSPKEVNQEKLKDEMAVAYREGSEEAVRNVLAEVEKQAERRIKSGFGEVNFTLGVINAIAIVYMFAAYPQHFWILYIIEAIILTALKFSLLIRNKPLNQALYYLDFCWIMNFIGIIALITLFAGKNEVSDVYRKHLFLAAYGISCGPLLGSTTVLNFVALIFHDVTSMTSVFIHVYPTLLLYNLRWRSDAIVEAWPNTFELDYDVIFFPGGKNQTPFLDSVFGNTILLYLAWFAIYTVWQLLIGLDLPRSTRHRKLSNGESAPPMYDTVFHSTMRQGLVITMGKIMWNRSIEESKRQASKSDFETRDFVVYMFFHLLASTTAILVLAYPCSLSPYVHGTFHIVLAITVTWRGAKRYTYYSTAMYSNLIRKQFLNSDEEKDEGFTPPPPVVVKS